MEIIQRIGDEMVSSENYFPMPNTPQYTQRFGEGGFSLGQTGGGGSGFLGFLEASQPIAAIGGSLLQAALTPTGQRQFTRFTAADDADFAKGRVASKRAADAYAKDIRKMGAQRMNALRKDLDIQLQEAKKVGRQIGRDISSGFDAQANAANQRMLSSGLSNTTVASGMNALVNRERGNALSRFAGQQASYISGILGQRASALAAERNFLDSQLSPIMGSDFSLRNMRAQRMGMSGTTSQEGYGSALGL